MTSGSQRTIPSTWPGLDLVVEERGHGDSPLVLLHGYTGGRLDWADVWDDLATNRRVVAYDQRGHQDSGKAGTAAAYDLGQLVADLGVVLDSVSDGPVDLIGHSMGGAVAMRFALANPERLRSLVLMDTFAEPLTVVPAEVIAATAAVGRASGMEVVAGTVAQLTSAFLAGKPHCDTIVERVRYKMTALDVEAFEALAAAIREEPSVLGRLGVLTMPVTVLVGADDLGLLAASDAIATAIPHAAKVVIPEAGHSPQEDQPALWLAAIEAHLSRAAV